jgi:hypothetical protein
LQPIEASIDAATNLDDRFFVSSASSACFRYATALSLVRKASPYPLPSNNMPFASGFLVEFKYPNVAVKLHRILNANYYSEQLLRHRLPKSKLDDEIPNK